MKRIPGFFYTALFFFTALMAISRIWVAEDAYITFRAVENFYHGKGLLYNPGEMVEVFTHPLWMMCLVIIRGIGLPLHAGSILLGLIFSLTSMALLIFRSHWKHKPLFPFAAMMLATISGFRDFQTAGMELSLVFFLLTLFYLFLTEYKLIEEPFLFATLLCLLYLARPELALLSIYYAFFYFLEIRSFTLKEIINKLLIFSLPFILFAGSYHLFRFIYFNDIFPNTFYAKSGSSSFYDQGFRYLAYTFMWSPSLWISLIIIIFFVYHLVHPAEDLFHAVSQPVLNFFRDAGALLLLIFYVIRVGGDFMAFRFFLPEIFMFLMLTERIFYHRYLWKKRSWIPTFLYDNAHYGFVITFLFSVMILFYPLPLYKGWVVDERWNFTKDMRSDYLSLFSGASHPWGESGKRFRNLQSCTGYEPFMITNSQAQAKCLQGIGLGYFGVAAGSYVNIYDEQALPNRDVALMPFFLRFRPGHEHYLTLNDVIKRGAIFCSTGEPAYDRIMATKAGIVIRLDPQLLKTLPEIDKRLERLSILKKTGSPVIPRLEERYSVNIDDLNKESKKWIHDPLYQSRSSCWEKFPGDPSDYFY